VNTVVKNKGGRPPGTGHGQQVVSRLRQELHTAFGLLNRRGRPISELLAEQLEKDAASTLNKLSSFLPREVNLTGSNSEFSLALGEVANRINEQNELLSASLEEANDMKQVIDITVENVEDAEIVPGIVPKPGKKSTK